ncbi:MAG: hypothetical protein V4819_08125 [Verrucomicrobiota bacterium]
MHEIAGIRTPGAVASESPEKHPKLWQWKLEWLGQTAIEKLVGLLPGPLVFRLGEGIGGLAWHFMRSRRQIVLRNLRIAFAGEHDLPTLRIMARQSFRRTGANLLSALRCVGLSSEEINSIVMVENPELVDSALTRSPGLVLLPSHMGNWEVLTRINRKLPPGHKTGAFYRPLNNPLLDARVLAQRELDGTRLFSKRDSFHLVAGFLREGGILGILADQRVGFQGELVRFFGRLTRASPLPSLIARRSKSQVLAMSVITESPGKWRIRYHSLDGRTRTASCVDAIEHALKASPLDYFWLQERWKVYVGPTRPIRNWLGSDSCGEGKPHRALLWLPGTPVSWEIPEEWTHPDVIYEVVPHRDGPIPARSYGNLYLHAGPDRDDRDSLAAFLEKIDASAALPIDYILTCKASKALVKAARLNSIPLVSLP